MEFKHSILKREGLKILRKVEYAFAKAYTEAFHMVLDMLLLGKKKNDSTRLTFIILICVFSIGIQNFKSVGAESMAWLHFTLGGLYLLFLPNKLRTPKVVICIKS